MNNIELDLISHTDQRVRQKTNEKPFSIYSSEDFYTSDEDDGNIYIKGPGDFEGYLTTTQSHLVKDIFLMVDQIEILRNPDYEYYIVESIDDYNLGKRPAGPNSIVFIGQTIIVKCTKWFWKVRGISSNPRTDITSHIIATRPDNAIRDNISLGFDWVEILKSQTPHIPHSFVVDQFWWRDPPANAENFDGKIKLEADDESSDDSSSFV